MADRQTQTRRRWLGTCATLAGATALAGCTQSEETNGNGTGNGTGGNDDGTEAVGEDWPMYGVDLQNTAYHPTVTNPDGNELTKRSISAIDGRSPYPVAVADGVVYVSSTAGKTYAIDTETEDVLWEKEGYGSPTIHGETVYGPTADGLLYSYDVETGERWESDEIESVIGLGAPIPTDNGIYVASQEEIWQFERETGAYTDVLTTPSFVGGSSEQPAYQDGIIYIARSSELHAVNVESPEIEWTFESDNEGIMTDSNPAVSDGLVFVGTREHQVHAVDIESGDEVWTVDTDSDVETSPAVANGFVYIGDNDRVIAIDIDEGTIEWVADDAVSGEPYDIVVANDVCYATTLFGVYALDSRSGELDWQYTVDDSLEGGFTASATVSDGTVYVPANDDTLYAIEDA
ncbi:outer membrane protein assembly factor BamB family protein [Halopiger goleimassiliensis]|uniref:outer membrane protein assembly factor BamB family protein n=1 Tax=Halopiger goleimassiliensis TaxID=1293048 RepID=UPI0009DB7C59|nr:PQQ-binding-like beta-propeller repeat protein [Halopiger goleimassiliensis]